MLKTLLVLSILVLLTITLLPAAQPTTATTATPATESLSCVSDCDAAKSTCWRKAVESCYGTSNAPKCRGEAYNQCMANKNCKQCFDGRTGAVWYCNCGRPSSGFGGGVKGGEDIQPYDYSEIPWDYTWEGWGCEFNPDWCDSDLWYL